MMLRMKTRVIWMMSSDNCRLAEEHGLVRSNISGIPHPPTPKAPGEAADSVQAGGCQIKD